VECKNIMIPAIMGATGTISKSLRKYLSNIMEKDKTRELHKTAILTLHTYFRKYYCKSTKHSTWEIALHKP